VFLNIYWFMVCHHYPSRREEKLIKKDKTKLSTSYPRLFLLNQLVFMSVFLGARIIFGGYQVSPLTLIKLIW
jgi:hypothetical protein